MNELYELNRDKNKYKNLRNNLSKIYDILSSSDLRDDLSAAASVLQNNYTIDNNSKYSRPINNIKDSINDNRMQLNNIIRDVDLKINGINKDIKELNNG